MLDYDMLRNKEVKNIDENEEQLIINYVDGGVLKVTKYNKLLDSYFDINTDIDLIYDECEARQNTYNLIMNLI